MDVRAVEAGRQAEVGRKLTMEDGAAALGRASDPGGAIGGDDVASSVGGESRPAVFLLQEEPIVPSLLALGVRDPACGGFASFEGWVRNNQSGRSVHSLRYEAYHALCLSEGRRVLGDAIGRFGIARAWAVHRVGLLAVGEIAVWIGVCSPHRREAFAACAWIIDEIKHALPIWKKEYFVDGATEWTDCPECAAAHSSAHPR